MWRDGEFEVLRGRDGCNCATCGVGSSKNNMQGRNTRLLNIPGQVYTIGNRYQNREEQGEFIALNCVDIPTEPSETYSCRFFCDERGNFWFKSVEGSELRINGRLVKEEAVLISGDLLVIGHPGRLCPLTSRFQKGVTLLFTVNQKPRAYRPGRHLKFLNPALSNSLILSKIFSYLSFTDLKSVRRVCQGWKGQGSESFKKKSILKCPHDYENSNYPNDPMDFFRCVHELRDFSARNICLDHIHWENRFNAKFMDDLSWFLGQSQLFEGIKGLVLGSSLNNQQLQRFLIKIAPQIEELDLDGCATAVHLPDFPALKKLWIKYPALGSREPESDERNSWISVRRLVTRVKNISSLNLQFNGRFYEVFLERHLELRNLRGLYLSEMDNTSAYYIANIQNRLTTLELGDISLGTENIPKFERVLEIHAPILENLQFISSNRINLPKTFPNLKSLRIGFSLEWSLILNKGANIAYQQTFPKLNSLEIMPISGRLSSMKQTGIVLPAKFWANYTNYGILRQFLPKNVNYPLSKTLKMLKIPEVDVKGDFENRECVIWSFGEMFPNVHNPWISMIREQQQQS